MIKQFVDKFLANKAQLEAVFAKTHPGCYKSLVKSVIELLADENEYNGLDPERIHIIDDGNYQGTLVFVIGASGYQPDKYWYIKVSYGSCSVCDTLQGIESIERGDTPNEKQIKDYMTLALHIVEGLKQMNDDE